MQTGRLPMATTLTAGELPIGTLFRLPGRRRRLLKIRNYGENVHLLTKRNGPLGEQGACYVQHDENGNSIHIPHITVRTMSGRKFDLPKDTEVEII